MIELSPRGFKGASLGLELAGELWGPESARHQVLALHGWQDNAASFSALGQALQADASGQWRMLALDLPGHGESDHLPPSQFYNLWDHVPLLANLIEQWGEPVYLCGHSMGAAIATLLAAVRPDLVRGLVTLDMIGLVLDPPDKQVERFLNTLQEQTEAVRPGRESPDFEHALQRRWRAGSPATRTANEALVRRGARQTESGWLFRLDPRVRVGSVMRLHEEQVMALCHRITCPWHVILGINGLFTEGRIEALKPKLPDCRILWWPGGHHFHMESSPSDLWQTIAESLSTKTDTLGANNHE